MIKAITFCLFALMFLKPASANLCPVGYTAVNETQFVVSVTDSCPVGYSKVQTITSCFGTDAKDCTVFCLPGYYINETNGECTECPAGSYCSGGTELPKLCTGATYSDAGASTCTSCPENYDANLASNKTSINQCQISVAEDFFIKIAGDSVATQCPVGYINEAELVNYNSTSECDPMEYTITLNKNGGTGTINGATGTTNATQTCKHGEVCDLPEEGLTKENFTFTGWGTSASCTSGATQMTFTGATTIYACWSQNTTQCQVGKYYDGTSHVECPSGKYCPGTGYANEGQPGCASTCPAGTYCPTNSTEYLTCPDGTTSESGAGNINECFKTCLEYDLIGGVAKPEKETVYYPEECSFYGMSDDGEYCDIIDNTCVKKVCESDYELKDGECVPCDREFAMTYKEQGNCQIETCVAGYFSTGTTCEKSSRPCEAPNAISAEEKWDFEKNEFGQCTAIECEDGYHIESGACISDTQQCNIANGVGIKEWNHSKNAWDKCIATYCDSGYTNDPAETNERIEQCGECRNKYAVRGELAVSSYVQGCEIAACMYQGERYNLENNECVPICPTEEYEDETGTMVWDESSETCIRTCKEGYAMW